MVNKLASAFLTERADKHLVGRGSYCSVLVRPPPRTSRDVRGSSVLAQELEADNVLEQNRSQSSPTKLMAVPDIVVRTKVAPENGDKVHRRGNAESLSIWYFMYINIGWGGSGYLTLASPA